MTLTRSTLYWKLKRRLRKFNAAKGGHGQYGQDIVAFNLLENVKNGVFVDIGANDGTTFSNSLLFEESGWSGICVEPHPKVFEILKKNRKCNLVNACISGEDTTVDFLVIEGKANMLSGIQNFMDASDLERIDREIEQYGDKKLTIQIESLSPITLLKRFAYSHIDFLSIDTEGCELQILKSIDFKAIPVSVISVENGSRTPEIFHHLTKVGFKLYKCVGCDEIYIKDGTTPSGA